MRSTPSDATEAPAWAAVTTEREQTLNQLLVEMDGFETHEGIILIAATNRPDVLDPALLRPGRFDRQVVVPNPDIEGRMAILNVHMRKIKKAPDVDVRTLARGTPGFSGADLENLVNEAALLASRRKRRMVSMLEFEDAKDKMLMGSERRTMVMTEDERKLTAYHEAGHALAALHCAASDPIHKATIVPRGRALGMVMRLPERDQISLSRDKLEANLVVAMGGRVAESLIFGADKITTGAANDIQQATAMARQMATEWGMSDKLGPLRYNENQEEIFLGHAVARQHNISEKTAELIDSEVRVFVETAEKRCRQILSGHPDQLRRIAEGLLEYETLTGEEIGHLAQGTPLDRPHPGLHKRPTDGDSQNKTDQADSQEASSHTRIPTSKKSGDKLGGRFSSLPSGSLLKARQGPGTQTTGTGEARGRARDATILAGRPPVSLPRKEDKGTQPEKKQHRQGMTPPGDNIARG